MVLRLPGLGVVAVLSVAGCKTQAQETPTAALDTGYADLESRTHANEQAITSLGSGSTALAAQVSAIAGLEGGDLDGRE